MELVWQPGEVGAQRDVALRLGPHATVGEVVAALTGATDVPAVAAVDGIAVDAGRPAADTLVRGARLALVADERAPRGPLPTAEVVVVGGLEAGARFPLRPGTTVLGRDRDAGVRLTAPTVSARHAELDVEPDGGVCISDLGSTNGVRVDGMFAVGPTPVPAGAIVEIGAAQLRIGPPAPRPSTNPAGPPRDGHIAFNRPPRTAPAPPTPPVRVPAAPADPSPRSRFGWAALVAPLVLGAVMAVFYDPRFAMFALFSPAMMLGNWIEDRRRARREARDRTSDVSAALDRLADDLRAASIAEIDRLRTLHPDPAGVLDRIGEPGTGPSPRLWERRAGDEDFLRLAVGTGAVPWQPPLAETGRERAEGVDDMLAQAGVLDRAPVAVDLSAGGVLGVVGADAEAVAALLRSLVVQVATLHGPADVRVAVLTADAQRWDWAKWLPHTLGAGGTRLIGADHSGHAEVLGGLTGAPHTFVVTDAPGITEGRNAPVRTLLGGGGPVSGVVVAPTADRLPAVCTAVLTLDGPDGAADCTWPATGARVDELLVAGIDAQTARAAARRLARYDDPETTEAVAGLPETVALADLVGPLGSAADEVVARWQRSSAAASLRAPLGATADGPLVVDLVADGPHALVAGTTGAGKSELLRTLVAGLAATYGPDDVNFVLVDYKGGSAFDVCADLPHTVGLVTDLDGELGSRALRCLEAELRYRERVLRAAGAEDLPAYAEAAPDQPLPRLLVVVDEFAALVADLPDFVDRLVGIAQRGRSLGVHLVLATQRPAGAVSDHIRANTNLRVALRVQDPADSSDVIGSDRAARLDRRHPGRGFVRLGPGETVAFQTALAGAPPSTDTEAVTVRDFVLGGTDAADVEAAATKGLDELVAAARDAFATGGYQAPRRPWPDPLPETIAVDTLAGNGGGGVVIGLADDPDRQEQRPHAFDPSRGNLLLYGVPGSGTTAALATIALALGDAGRLAHCYVLDFGKQSLAPLADLPWVGAVVGSAERERQERLVRWLGDEIHRRRRLVSSGESLDGEPQVVVLLESYGGFAAAFDDIAGMAVVDAFTRVIADGPALGVCAVVSADRPGAIPMPVAALVPDRLLFRLADRHDYATFGVRGVASDLPFLRAIDAGSGLVVQIGDAGDVDAAVAGRAGAPLRGGAPRPVGTLPPVVALADLPPVPATDTGEWFVPLGVDDRTLGTAGLLLGAGDHALVGGPARSGKSTTLVVVAAAAAARGDFVVTAVAPRRSPLRDCRDVDRVVTAEDDLDAVLDAVATDDRPQLVLVDDADMVDDPTGAFARLFAARRSDVHVIAAGRTDALRSAYGHWTTELRRERRGVALRPNLDMDGDLWQTALPRRAQRLDAGRGFLLSDGTAELVQVAIP